MNPPSSSPGEITVPQAALDALAAALDPALYATTLTTAPGRPLRLTVTSRNCQIGDDIHADHRAYYWSWGEWIAPHHRPGDRRPHDQRGAAAPAPGPPVTDNLPAPGHDQIAVTAPAARTVCNTREHTRLGVLADVVVTFGTLGAASASDALWPGTWGHSYPMCAECWEATRRVAQRYRPGLAITGAQP